MLAPRTCRRRALDVAIEMRVGSESELRGILHGLGKLQR
jgi:hypothetical protein